MSELRTTKISKTFGGLRALHEVEIEVRPGQIVGLIGPNGAGKSTLLSILAGEQKPTTGDVLIDDRTITRFGAAQRSRLGVARTFQNLRLFGDSSVFDNVVVGASRWRHASPAARITRRRRADVGQQASAALERVGLDRASWGRAAGGLPYIQQRLLEVARCLTTEPTFLLLDEPVAGANDPERDALSALVRSIADSGIGIVVIEHDMRFLFGLAEAITVLDHGEVISRGSADEVRNDSAVVDAYLGTVSES